MTLSVSSFARTYIFDPLNDQLSLKEKIAATVTTVALAILLVGVIYYVGRFCLHSIFKKASPSDTPKVKEIQQGALPIPTLPKKAQPQFNSDLTQLPLPPAERTLTPGRCRWSYETLQAWLASQESQNPIKPYLGEKEDVEAISTTINELIATFDRDYQIKARLAALVEEDATWFIALQLTVWDLEEEFFPFALMMDAEFQQITLAQVGNRDLTRLQERLEMEACRAKIDDKLVVTRENFMEVPLVQLLNVGPESLNELLPHFPDWLLRCLPSRKIPKINVDKLSKHQLKLLFKIAHEDAIWACRKTSGNLQALDPATQLNETLMFRLDSFSRSLTDSQIAAFVRKTDEISSELFTLLFPIVEGNNLEEGILKKRINSLDIQDILRLSDQFTEHHWQQLSQENFEKIARNHTAFLHKPINDSKASLLDIYHSQHLKSFTRWIRELQTQRLAEFSGIFSASQWSLLTDDQVVILTIAKPELLEIKVGPKTVFQILYPQFSSSERLQKLPLDTITRISPHFTLNHWGSLSLDQKLGVFRRPVFVEQTVFNAFFPPNGNLLAGLPIEPVLELCYRFEEAHWRQLSDAQVSTLTDKHTEKLNEKVGANGGKTVFQILYPDQFTGYDHADQKEKIKGKVQKFTHAALVSLAPQFTEEHWSMLTDEQVLELTRKQPDLLAAKVGNKTVFETLYAWAFSKRLKELTVADISAICPLLQNRHWCELSVEMKTEITNQHQDFFDKNKDAFPALYPAQANADPERYERISFKALMALSQRFEEGHWVQLSPNLVKRITEERTETLKNLVGQKTVFQLFYPVATNQGSRLGLTPFQTKIQNFTPKIVAELAPLFERQHWEYLSSGVVKHLVRSNPQIFLLDVKCGTDWVFNKFITTKRDFFSIYVSELPLDSLLVLSPKFTESHWKALSADQLQALRQNHADKLPEFLRETK